MKRILKAIPLARSLHLFLKKREYERRFSGECYGCFRGIYENFEQAVASTPKTKSLGYDQTELAEEYKIELQKIIKEKKIRSYDYPILFWLRELIDQNVRVFDFGGNVGIHFHLYRKYISFPPSLRWVVCDLPEIVKAGKEINEIEKRPEITFTCSFDEADGTDILLASGSIQYVESLSDFLQKLTIKPKHLLLNRLPLYQGEQFVTLQNGGQVFYPQYVFNEKDFIVSIEKLGYELIDAWEDLVDSCIVPFYLEKAVPFYHGLYFHRRF